MKVLDSHRRSREKLRRWPHPAPAGSSADVPRSAPRPAFGNVAVRVMEDRCGQRHRATRGSATTGRRQQAAHSGQNFFLAHRHNPIHEAQDVGKVQLAQRLRAQPIAAVRVVISAGHSTSDFVSNDSFASAASSGSHPYLDPPLHCGGRSQLHRRGNPAQQAPPPTPATEPPHCLPHSRRATLHRPKHHRLHRRPQSHQAAPESPARTFPARQ